MKTTSFFKLLLTVLSIVAFAAIFQSCSNPFNPESQFLGKWDVVEYDGKATSYSVQYEFLPHGVVVATTIGGPRGPKVVEKSAVEFDFDKKTLLASAVFLGGFYEFEGNNTLRIQGNGLFWVLKRSK